MAYHRQHKEQMWDKKSCFQEFQLNFGGCFHKYANYFPKASKMGDTKGINKVDKESDPMWEQNFSRIA